MAHFKFLFSDSSRVDPNEWNSPQAVAQREALQECLESSRQKQALERAKSDPAVAMKIALLEHRRALAHARIKSLTELAGAHRRTFTHAEAQVFDEAFAETEQIDRQLKNLVKG